MSLLLLRQLALGRVRSIRPPGASDPRHQGQRRDSALGVWPPPRSTAGAPVVRVPTDTLGTSAPSPLHRHQPGEAENRTGAEWRREGHLCVSAGTMDPAKADRGPTPRTAEGTEPPRVPVGSGTADCHRTGRPQGPRLLHCEPLSFPDGGSEAELPPSLRGSFLAPAGE